MPSNNIESLDEGALKTIIDLYSKADRFITNYGSNLSKIKADRLTHSSSIARSTRDLTLSFPTICSDAVSGETAAIINKAIELKNVTMIQMLSAAAHFTGYNAIDVVSKIHNNMGVKYNVDDYIDSILALRNTHFEACEIPLTGRYRVIAERCKENFLRDSKRLYPLSSLSENSINDYYVMDSYGEPKVFLKEKSAVTGNSERFSNDELKDIYDLWNKQQANKIGYEEFIKKLALQSQKDRESLDVERRKYNLSVDQYEHSKKNDKYKKKRDKRLDAYNQAKDLYDQKHAQITRQLLDSDVKKANELTPTMILLRYQVTDPNGDPSKTNLLINDEFVAGVKSRLIPVSSSDIIERIVNFASNRKTNKTIVQFTSGEKDLAKDLLSSIQAAKIQASKDSKLSKNNAIWRSLQARSNKSKLIRLARMRNSSAAISTLVITQVEADAVKDDYNIDMNNPNIAAAFMDAYNLMALVIVDEQFEVAHFIYDGDSYFEDLSFSALQKENDKSYKQVINLLNKTR